MSAAGRGAGWVITVLALLPLVACQQSAALRSASPTPVLSPTPPATSSPTAEPSTVPLEQALSVPVSTPAILYHDLANFDQLDGVTWDGKTSGKVGLGAKRGGSANPQGTLYSTATDLRDRSGVVVDSSVAIPVFWADDGVHFCNVVRTKSRDVTGPGMLQLATPGRAPRNVVQVGTIGAEGLNAGGPVIIACSPLSDRAVVYQAGGQGVGVQEVWVIQLSTGRTLWHGGGGSWIAVTHDGQYVALSPAPGSPTMIYGPNGSVAGTNPEEVFAFSWDGSLAVVAGSFGSVPKIIDWRTGHTIWTCPNNTFQYWEAFPEPAGSHIAIGVADPLYKNTNGFQPVHLFVVGADGVVSFEKDDVTLFQ